MNTPNPFALPSPSGANGFPEEGMSLRDYFAGQALAGLCANETFQDVNADLCMAKDIGADAGMAIAAYELANAMLAARQKQIDA